MKKFYLFAAIMILCAIGQTANAQQWTPSAPEDGGTYYLYNVGKGGFLVKNSDKGKPALEPTAGAYVILEQDEATTTSEGKSFRIDTHLVYASTGTNQDRWLVENTSDRNVYINVGKSHEMHNPWRFVPVEGKPNVYYIILASGADANRHLEFSSLNKGTAADPVTRSTGSSTSAGAPGFDEWMLVTPEDYNAAFAQRVDATDKVGTERSSWTGASGTAGSVTTITGVTTALAELYDNSSAGVKMSQTITGLDNGYYEVRVFASSHNARGEAGASLNGITRDVANVFATSGESNITKQIVARGVNPGFEGDEQTYPYTLHDVVVKDGTMTIGLNLATANQTGWHTIQIYSLVKTGDLPLTEKIEAYEAALASAQEKAADTDGLPEGFRSVLQSVIDANDDVDYTSAEALDNATANLNAAITTVETSRIPYSRYKIFRAQALALDDDETAFTGTARVDVSDADAVVAAATTIEAINAAIPMLRTDVKTFINSVNVEPGKCFDISILLVNNDFEEGTTTGWTAEGEGTWRVMYANATIGYGAETYHGTRNIYQTIDGIPAGLYKASVQATWRDAQTTGLYITTGSTATSQIQQQFSGGAIDAELTSMANDPTFACFSVENSLIEGNLTVGLKEKAVGDGGCWTLFDNFHLYYYGLDYSDAEARLEAALVNAEATAAKSIPQAVKDELNALRSTYTAQGLEAEGTYAEVLAAFDAAIADINSKIENANALVDPYARFIAIVNAKDPIIAQTTVYTDDDDSEKTKLQNAINAAQTNANAATTTEGINNQTAALYAAYADFIETTNISGKYFDLTSLIYNHDFTLSGRTGWEKEGNAGGLGRITGDGIFGYEYWNGTFNFYQTLPVMPAGSYKFNVNAFHRISDNANDERNADRTNIPALVYIDNASENMMSIQEGAAMSSSNAATAINTFSSGDYDNVVMYTTDEAKENLKIGLKLDEQSADYSWTLFSNFRLYYTKAPADVTLSETDETNPEACDLANVTLTRTLKANVWNTLTLPFSMDIPEGWSVKALGSTENIDGHVRMNFVDASSIEAGVPYMVQVGETEVTSIVREGVAIVPEFKNVATDDLIFKGNFAKIAALPVGSFFIQSNKFYEVGATNIPAMKGYRAYLESVDGGSVKSIEFNFDGEPTSIEMVEDEDQSVLNGQIYDLSGRAVQNPVHGLYIMNGKKILIK